MKFILIVMSFLLFQPASVMAQVNKQNNIPSTMTNSTTPIKAIHGFLGWYKQNYRKLYKFRLTYADPTGNYRVDIKDCIGYFSALTSSGYISQTYVKLWSEYCTSQDEKFKISPQNEGPPEGFDMDLVLHTQEPDEVTKHYKRFKYSTKTQDKSSAVIFADTGWPDWVYVFELSKIKGRWYIDYISIKEPD